MVKEQCILETFIVIWLPSNDQYKNLEANKDKKYKQCSYPQNKGLENSL